MGEVYSKATAANSQIRAFAATTRDLVEYARAAHNTSPVATGALGRLLQACHDGRYDEEGGEGQLLTLQVKAGGPLKRHDCDSGFQRKRKGLCRESECGASRQ